MKEYVSTILLIVDYRKYANDIVFIGISPYDGQRYVIVKGGSKGTSRRAKIIDIGNLIKAKIYQRNHWYLSEAEALDSFTAIKTHLPLIVMYQALLAVLKIAYVMPEKKIFYAIYNTLRSVEMVQTEEKRELSLFLLVMRVLSHYGLIAFPFKCSVCDKKIYNGYYDRRTFEYYCDEHKIPEAVSFSIKSSKDRVEFLSTILKHLLNISFKYTVPLKKAEQKSNDSDQTE